ncbi:hypothetical protein [Candidatus Magnetaquicoccus inordinatus]|uniref:hypothetical protein n=1 Tax=Candidatus Magnetaquicoccus inordinatus TaxID=2496818 RepID=UPI00102BF41A|nr:hypothetical protein [Candidatus Magnetaquicoccus inordinatus]
MNGQSVNFYHDDLRPARPFLPGRWLLLSWLLLAMALLLLSYGLQEQLAVRRQLQQQQERLLAPTPGAVPAAGQESAAMADCLASWKKIEGELAAGSALPLATVLEQLAVAHVPGVRLRQLLWQRGAGKAEEYLELSGQLQGVDEEGWQRYQRQLLEQPVLAGYMLRELQREGNGQGKERSAATPGPFSFRLRIEAAEGKR